MDIRIEIAGGGQQMPDTLLPGDPSDERRDGQVGTHPQFGQYRPGVRVGGAGMPQGRVDPVVHHVDPARVQRRVCVEHVVAHPLAHRDDRVGVFDRVALRPRREPVTTAELLGLPRTSRFERMRGEHVRDPVQRRGQMPREPGVPGVGMHHVDVSGGVGHAQLRRHHLHGGVGRVQHRIGLVHHGIGAGHAHAVHGDIAEHAESIDELRDVHARAAVHLGWILPGQHGDPQSVARGDIAVPRPVSDRRQCFA